MRLRSAALGSAAFFLAAPAVVAGVLPWWITRWELDAGGVRVVTGGAVVAAGAAVVVRAFVRFAREGRGTPAPVAPTERLVVGGDYRYVRNPMYVGVVGAVLGQALLFGSWPLLAYALLAWATMAAFVAGYEEPVLEERFGEQYDRYRRWVRAWLPRLRPWRGEM